MAYSVGFAVIKYQEGYTDLPGYGSALYNPCVDGQLAHDFHSVMAKPWQLWTQTHKSFILPLYLLFAVAWSLEM